MKEVTKDKWGNPYIYRYAGAETSQDPEIISYGPDGHEGGGDDITNRWGSSRKFPAPRDPARSRTDLPAPGMIAAGGSPRVLSIRSERTRNAPGPGGNG